MIRPDSLILIMLAPVGPLALQMMIAAFDRELAGNPIARTLFLDAFTPPAISGRLTTSCLGKPISVQKIALLV
jgi:hypothetical protein